MFELTISITMSKASVVKRIYENIYNYVKSVDGIIILQIIDKRAVLSIAVKNKNKDYLVSLLLEFISDAFISCYKREYLDDQIQNYTINEKLRNTLLVALTEFDKTTDIDLIKKQLILTNNILLDSLYYFKLSELKERWKDIANLVNNNIESLIASGCICDMIKFLIYSMPEKTDELYIIQSGDTIEILDNIINKTIIKKYKKQSKNIDEELLKTIITLSPKRIYISSEIIDNSCLNQVKNIFDEKILIFN